MNKDCMKNLLTEILEDNELELHNSLQRFQLHNVLVVSRDNGFCSPQVYHNLDMSF
jgi:hypothetical protein